MAQRNRKTETHWAPWDAPRYKSLTLAACGVHARDRELALHGQAPTCPTCLRRFIEFENLKLTTDTGE